MKNHCLVSMNVKVFPPRSIPSSEGKAIRVIDCRNEAVLAYKVGKGVLFYKNLIRNFVIFK